MTAEFLYLDLETRSDVAIRTCGSYVYFESPTTDVLIACYAFDDGPIETWLRGQPCPPALREHIVRGGRVSGWNVFGFERLAFQRVLGPRYGWPVPRLEQFDDTMHQAAAQRLPRALDHIGEVLDLPVKKDKEGRRLIQKFSTPRRPRKGEPPGLYWNEPEDHPQDFAKFIAYCVDDVGTERAAKRKLMPLSPDELEITYLDATINDRGIRIDRTSALAAIEMAERAKVLLDRDMTLTTGGVVTACSQVAKLTEWVQDQGVELGSLAKAELEELLDEGDLPPHVRTALELRQEYAKTSVSKLSAMLRRANADGRIRGTQVYHGAGTGRWQSAGVNFYNLPRPRKIYSDVKPRTDVLFRAIRTGDPNALRLLYPDEPEPRDAESAKLLYPDSDGHLGRPLHLLSDAIRSFIWAAPGHDLLAADYSGIEGAIAAWMAGEDWKLKALREIIADPAKPDLYRHAAAAIFNVSPDDIGKKDIRRQVGKVSELSMQYGGGPGAYRSMARQYSLRLDPLFPIVWPAAGEARRERALRRLENAVARNEPTARSMSREAFLASECIKLGWRSGHPAISATWGELEDAIIQAVAAPGEVAHAVMCDYVVARGFLWCRLPSGRVIAYGAPRTHAQVWARMKTETGEWGEAEIMTRTDAEWKARFGLCTIENEAKSAVTVLGRDSTTGQWKRFALYGGLAFENCVQGVAACILRHGIRRAEAAGYPVLFSVYDEIVTEVPRGFGDLSAFEKLICELPPWAEGLPLTAAGWRGKRYRKD